MRALDPPEVSVVLKFDQLEMLISLALDWCQHRVQATVMRNVRW